MNSITKRLIPSLMLGLSMTLLAGAASAQGVAGDEYAAIGYNDTAHANSIARLAAKIESGEVELEYRGEHGYFDSFLEHLGVDPSSQVLVFSPTSLQYMKIAPGTPRALYFSEDTYVGWVLNSDLIELMAIDDDVGIVFYVFHNSPRAPRKIEREGQRCLVCHDSTGTMGGGVPLLLARSGIYSRDGLNLLDITGDGNTTDKTPVAERWGGWYVTGSGTQDHLGNMVLSGPAQLQQVDSLHRIGLETLADSDLLDIRPYLRDTSDIVALMVMEHQLTVQNQLSYVKFKAPVVLDRIGHGSAGDAATWADLPERAQASLTRMLDNLLAALLMIDNAPLDAAIGSTSGFTEWLEQRGPRDSQGRSLYQLDLQDRLFTYPLSYLVYSPEVQKLPPYVLDYVYRKLAAILTGEDRSAPFDQLVPAQLAETLEILRATAPESMLPYLTATPQLQVTEN